MALSSEELATLGNLENLPLAEVPVPLQDYKAQGTYAQGMSIPGDIAPVSSSLSARGLNYERRLTAIDPGYPGFDPQGTNALAVYNVGPTSIVGSVGPGAQASYVQFITLTDLDSETWPMGVLPGWIYHVVVTIYPKGPSTGNLGAVQIYLRGNNSGFQWSLASLAVPGTDNQGVYVNAPIVIAYGGGSGERCGGVWDGDSAADVIFSTSHLPCVVALDFTYST